MSTSDIRIIDHDEPLHPVNQLRCTTLGCSARAVIVRHYTEGIHDELCSFHAYGTSPDILPGPPAPSHP